MKRMVKIGIYTIIITLFLQKILVAQGAQVKNSGNRVQRSVLISTTPYKCEFESGIYVFTLPGCNDYKPGTVLNIEGFIDSDFSKDNLLFDTGFFKKKRLIIASIDESVSIGVSPELWLEHLFFVFNEKKASVLGEFLPLLGVQEGYLTGRLSLGFSEVKSKNVDHLFKVTGMQYLASISGFHLNLVVRFFSNMVGKFFNKKLTSVISLLVSGLYLLFVGPKVPLVRAFLMLSMSIVSSIFFLRQNSSLNSLFLVGLLLVYLDITVLSSISFQLSFVATASIIFFVKHFKSSNLANLHISRFESKKNRGKKTNKSAILTKVRKYIVDSAKISIYVQVALVPLVLYHFNEFSVISLLVSIALTWLVPGIIILTLFLIFLKTLGVSELLMRILVLPLNFLSKIFLQILKFFDNEVFLIKVSDFPWWYILIWWGVVALIFKLFFRKKQKRQKLNLGSFV